MIACSNILDSIETFTIAERERIRNHDLNAGFLCMQFPDEILAGCGLHPIRIESGTGPHAERTGEHFIRPDACPFCKSVLGNLLEDSFHRQILSMLIGTVTCDMMRRTLDLLQKDGGIPVFPVHVPATRSDNARDYYRAEITALVDAIVAHTGRPFRVDACRNHFLAKRRCAEILHGILARGTVPHSITSRLMHLFHVASPERLGDYLEEIRLALPESQRRTTVILVGSTLSLEDSDIPDCFERHGIGMINLTCGGLHSLERHLAPVPNWGEQDKADCIRDCADSVFTGPACIRNRPNQAVYDRIREWIGKTGASGIVLKALKFCDLWFTEKQRMRELIGIPILVLDTDYSDRSNESLVNRIEAFIEILEPGDHP